MDKVNKDLMNSLGRSPNPPSSSREASCQNHRPGRRLLLPDSCNQGAKKYSAVRQKAYYFGVPSPEASSISEDVYAAPCTYLSLVNQADLEQHTPKVTTFKMPESTVNLLDAQVIGPTTEHLIESDFSEQSFKPKVQIAFQTLPGQCPRSIEIESTEQEPALLCL